VFNLGNLTVCHLDWYQVRSCVYCPLRDHDHDDIGISTLFGGKAPISMWQSLCFAWTHHYVCIKNDAPRHIPIQDCKEYATLDH
jgi:hypothetical protein